MKKLLSDMVKMQKINMEFCGYIQNVFYIIMHKINALRCESGGHMAGICGNRTHPGGS